MAEVKHPDTESPSVQAPEPKTGTTAADAPTVSAEQIVAEALRWQMPQPTLAPPTEEAAAAAEAGIAAWHNGKKITALWCNDSPRNAYISVPGMGWRKLSNANDSSFVTMTMLASHAEQTNANVNIRIESDGTVHEIYVW